MDRDDWFPEAQFRALHEIGLLGTSVPERYGGQGLGFIEQCLITEALSYWNASFGAAWMGSESICLHNLVRNADDALKARYLPGFCAGSLIGALGLTEPGAGSDALGSMATRAVRDGDDFVIDGRKMFISLGPVADLILLYAKTSPGGGRQGRHRVRVRDRNTRLPGGPALGQDGLARGAHRRAGVRQLPGSGQQRGRSR